MRGENEIFDIQLVSAWCLMVDCSIVQWTEGKCTTIAETTNKHGGEKVSPKQSADVIYIPLTSETRKAEWPIPDVGSSQDSGAGEDRDAKP